MVDHDREREIADEKAFEIQYLDALIRRADDFDSEVGNSVRNTFTDRVINPFPRHGSLVGRVALDSPDFKEMYIGDVSHDFGEKLVVSWPTRVAQCVFYRKPSVEHVEWCERVTVIRTFTRRVGKISDFDDEVLAPGVPSPYFETRTLTIPTAPSIRIPVIPDLSTGQSPEDDLDNDIAPEKSHPDREATDSNKKNDIKSRLRSVPLLSRVLKSPKKMAMSAVLGTLQPDQIDFVTKTANENMILQGHPGTGKTIIAVHRAAFLLHPDYSEGVDNLNLTEPVRQPKSVLIIGPTDEWVAHVKGALKELVGDENTYRAISMSEFENELSGSNRWTDTGKPTALPEVSQEIAELVELAIARVKGMQKRNVVTRDEVYRTLLSIPADPPPQGIFRDWVELIARLPKSLSGLTSSRDVTLRPLLAYLGARTGQSNKFKTYEHLIIDEAQDVYPIQWETLGRLGNPGGWTIIGDLNQRRTDHTYGSWESISELLGFGTEGSEHPIFVLDIGYRSTSQIIKFADQLLPRTERKLFSIQQDGEKPKVVRISKKEEVPLAVLNEANLLIDRVEGGTVAIITTSIDLINRLLVKQGWQKTSVGNSWRNGERTLHVLSTDRARGLEFDGVVVVEPSEFPENLGRLGVLYTALTRANRYLTVVHNQTLPKGMKREV